MKSRSHIIFTSLLLIGDIIAILGAYSLAYVLRVKISANPVANIISAEAFFSSLLILVPVITVVFILLGIYRTDRRKKISAQIIRVITGAVVAMLVMITIDYFRNDHIFPAKLVPIYGLLFSVVLLATVRVILAIARRIWWRKDSSRPTVLVVGGDYGARPIIDAISRKDSGYKLMGVVGDGRFNFTTHRSFEDAVKRHTPGVIIQIASQKEPTINPDILDYSISHYTEFKFIPADANDLPSNSSLELFMGDVPVLNIQQTALNGWGRLSKRFFDVLVSFLALIILSPIMLAVALINKVVFGRIIFRQTRLTRGYREFGLYKFQTIHRDLNGLTPEEAFKKLGRPELIKPYRDNGDFLPDDPRYGGWAKFLRRSSLDELPQLWNVLIGDISLVGPRALIPQELDAYDQKHQILSVKSGITGLAQISGRKSLAWDQRRKLDVYYAQNWSFGLDVQILISTAWQVVTGRGAR